MELLCALPVVLLVSLALFAGFIRRQARDQSWRRAARLLNLEYEPAGLAGFGRIHGFLQRHEIAIDAQRVQVAGRTDDATRYRVTFHQPLGLDLIVARGGETERFAEQYSWRDIRVGDPSFDAIATVAGEGRRRVQAFLSPERRAAIKELLVGFDTVTIDTEGIEVTSTGLEDDPERMSFVVERMLRTARYLHSPVGPTPAAEPEDRAPLIPEPTLLGTLETRHGETATDRDSADRDEEPADVAGDAAPEETSRVPESERPAAESASSGAEPDSSNDDSGPLAAGEICDDLFGTRLASSGVTRRFDEHYRGKQAVLSGRLVRIERVSFDLVFGFESATLATVELNAVDLGLVGERMVRGVVRVSEGTAELLRNRVGEQVTIEGVLLACDPVSLTLRLDEG